MFNCPEWPRCGCPDGTVRQGCPGLKALTAASAIRAPQGVVTVTRVECVDWSKGYEEPAEPIWRIEINGYCADFETETAAQNFAAEINRLATPAPSSGEAEPVRWEKQEYGATVATIYEDADGCLEVVKLGKDKLGAERYGLTVHQRVGETDRFEDCSIQLKAKHFAALGSVVAHPSPSGVNAPADEDAALANFDSFKDSFFATHRAAMGVNAEVVAALEAFAEPRNWTVNGRFDPHSGNFDGTSFARSALQSQAAASGAGEKPTHRHKKRGSEYVLLGIGKMQAEGWFEHDGNADRDPSVDMREVAIYRSVDDGSLWVRPREEFEDGRFEALSPTPTEPTEGR